MAVGSGGGGGMIAFTSYSLEPRLQQKTEHCFVPGPRKSPPSLSRHSVEGREERTEPLGNLGIKGIREVELECLNNQAVVGLVPGVWVMLSCASLCSMHASLLDQLEIRGLVTMGIDGCCWQWEKESSWN